MAWAQDTSLAIQILPDGTTQMCTFGGYKDRQSPFIAERKGRHHLVINKIFSSGTRKLGKPGNENTVLVHPLKFQLPLGGRLFQALQLLGQDMRFLGIGQVLFEKIPEKLVQYPQGQKRGRSPRANGG